MRYVAAILTITLGLTGTADVLGAAGPSSATVIAHALTASELCGSGPKADKEAQAWCNVRTALGVVLELRGWCYGRKYEPESQFKWHKCRPGSIHIKNPR